MNAYKLTLTNICIHGYITWIDINSNALDSDEDELTMEVLTTISVHVYIPMHIYMYASLLVSCSKYGFAFVCIHLYPVCSMLLKPSSLMRKSMRLSKTQPRLRAGTTTSSRRSTYRRALGRCSISKVGLATSCCLAHWCFLPPIGTRRRRKSSFISNRSTSWRTNYTNWIPTQPSKMVCFHAYSFLCL